MANVLNIFKEFERGLHVLVDRYADLEFVDDVQDLTCVRCDRVAIVHFISNCDDIFCSSCKISQLESKQSCPKCQQPITKIADKKVGVEIKIFGLRMQCPNQKYGCEEVATLVEITNHLKTCPNTRKLDSVTLENQDNEDRTSIKTVVQRLDAMAASLCSGQERQTQFEDFMNKRLNTMMDDLTRLKSQVHRLEKELTAHNHDVSEASALQPGGMIKTKNVLGSFFETTFVWDINQNNGDWFSISCVNSKLNVPDLPVRRLTSPNFAIKGHPIKAQVTLMGSGYVFIKFRNDINDKQPLQIGIPLPTITYSTFIDGQLYYSREQHIGFSHRIQTNASYYTAPTVHLLEDINAFMNGAPFTLQISVNFPHLVEPPFSTDGTLTWRVNYSESECGWMYSPYFYSGPEGYRLNVGLNGLSAYINFLTGEFDHELPENCDFIATVTLVDQFPSAPYGDVVNTVTLATGDQVVEGIQILKQAEAICNVANYLKDNFLLLKIELKPI